MLASATGEAGRPVMRAEPQMAPANLPQSFEAVIALAEKHRDIRLQTELTRFVRLVKFEPGRIELAMEPLAEADLPNRLHRALLDWTGARWGISITEPGQADLPKTLHELAEEKRAEEKRGVQSLPAVQAVLRYFPGAEIIRIEEARLSAAAEAVPIEADEAPEFTDDDL
jgi:DNA polymerase-3 subunit gamma/tau